MTVALRALVLPAFADLEAYPSEVDPWTATDDLDRTLEVQGVAPPLRYSDDGLGVLPTGIGKVAAAITTTRVLTAEELDLEGALVVSVGVAGGPPNRTPFGSVVLADTIVDWDLKLRWDDPDSGTSIAPLPFDHESPPLSLDAGLLERAMEVASAVSLETPKSESEAPIVTTGVNLCGDELWHGHHLATQARKHVADLVERPYAVTEMEDMGTARALERAGKLDAYLSVRGIANPDRPPSDRDAASYLDSEAFRAGFSDTQRNATRVARAVIDQLRPPQ